MKNWEQRLLTEMEAPHKWNEAWGDLFSYGVPIEYSERIKYLEYELKNMKPPPIAIKAGEGYKDIGNKDYKRKKMFIAAAPDLEEV